MKKIRRILLLAFVLSVLLGCLMLHASAAEVVASGYCGGEGDGTNLSWTLDSEGTLTITGDGIMQGNPMPWTKDHNSIKKVVIGDGVTTISDNAFASMDHLTSVTISDSVTTICEYAFLTCGQLSSVDFGDNVTTIGHLAFYECNLTSVSIPDSVTSIGAQAFEGNFLTSVTIGNGVKTIGRSAFYCNNNDSMSVYFKGNAPSVSPMIDEFFPTFDLATLYYISGMTGWTDSDAYNATNNTWNGYKLAVWEEYPFIASGYCGGEGEGSNLEWSLDNEGTLFITGTGEMKNYYYGDYAAPWYNNRKSIEEIVVGENVATIGDFAFYDCDKLTSIIIPNGVRSIGSGAFRSCTRLTSVIIPDSVIGIGPEAFRSCGSLVSITIPNSVTCIDSEAFYNCNSLTSVTIPDKVRYIDFNAFSSCDNLKTINFEGNAPSVCGTFVDASFDADVVTLYYIPGTTGWTDSEAYDAEAGTWNGYKLVVWEEMVPEEKIPYTFTTSMTKSLDLESEVFMNVCPQVTGKDGNALTTSEAKELQSNVGIMFWDAAEAPSIEKATVYNCDNIIWGSKYNTSTKRFEVRTAGIPAKNLGDALAFRSVYTDGKGNYIYGKYETSYSPMKYCYSLINKGSAAKDVCIALLNYGAAAQVYFDYKTDQLMNADLSEDQRAWEWDDTLVREDWTVDPDKEGTLTRNRSVVNSRGGTLELEGAINVVFTGGVKNIEVAKAELLLWTEADYETADVLTEENASQIVDMTMRNDGKYEYIYEGIAAKYMFKAIYSCQKYTDTNGNVYYGGVMPFCAERYGYQHTEDGSALGDLAKAMVIYGDACRSYFPA